MRALLTCVLFIAAVSTASAGPLFQTPKPQSLIVPIVGCGMAPMPPMGCQMSCVCDRRGHNCSWQTVCG